MEFIGLSTLSLPHLPDSIHYHNLHQCYRSDLSERSWCSSCKRPYKTTTKHSWVPSQLASVRYHTCKNKHYGAKDYLRYGAQEPLYTELAFFALITSTLLFAPNMHEAAGEYIWWFIGVLFHYRLLQSVNCLVS